MAKKLTHLDTRGQAKMVNVGGKPVTARVATAEGYVVMSPTTLRAIAEERVAKGEVLAVARVAGIMAAKRTGELIPLCHGLSPDAVAVDFDVPVVSPDAGEKSCRIRIRATATIHAKTGIEMEALTAVSVAALTIYDMCKAVDQSMVIEGVRLIRKTGGKSDYRVE